MVDYNILEQFVTFYRTGTLRETAKQMHISQPALTRNIQKLEAEFEVPLFHRTKNSISLNETGLLAAEDAAMLLKQTENMLRHARRKHLSVSEMNGENMLLFQDLSDVSFLISLFT